MPRRCVPSPILQSPSQTSTSNTALFASILATRAIARTVRPNGVAERWRMSTAIPTLIYPAGGDEAMADPDAVSNPCLFGRERARHFGSGRLTFREPRAEPVEVEIDHRRRIESQDLRKQQAAHDRVA